MKWQFDPQSSFAAFRQFMYEQPVEESLRIITALGSLFYGLSPSLQVSPNRGYLIALGLVYSAFAITLWSHRFLYRYIHDDAIIIIDLIVSLVLLLLTTDNRDSDAYLLLVPALILGSRQKQLKHMVFIFSSVFIILLLANLLEIFTYEVAASVDVVTLLVKITFSLLYNLGPRILILTLVSFYSWVYLRRGEELQEQVEKIQDQQNELQTVRSTFLDTIRGADLVKRLEEITKWATKELRSTGCKVYVRYNQRLYLVAITADTDKVKKLPAIGYSLPIQEGLHTGIVVRTALSGEVINVPVYSQSEYHLAEFEAVFDAMITLPLKDEHKEVFAVVMIFDKDNNRIYAEEDEERLHELEPYFGLIILERLLYRRIELRQQLRERLIDAGWRFNASLQLDRTLNAVVNGAYELIHTFHSYSLLFPDSNFPGIPDPAPLMVCILLFDEESSLVKITAAAPSFYLPDLQQKFGTMNAAGPAKGLSGRAFVETTEKILEDGELIRLPGKTIVCNNIPLEHPSNYIKFSEDTISELAVPLRIGKRVIAVINIEHLKENAFPEELIELTELLASQAASAIQNALQYEQIESEKSNLLKLYNLIFRLGETRNNLQSFIDGAFETIQDLMVPYDSGTLQFINLEMDQRRILGTYGLSNDQRDDYLERVPSKDDFLLNFMDERQTRIYYPNIDPPRYWETIPATENIIIWIGIPLLEADNCYGVLTLHITNPTIGNKKLDIGIQVLDMVGRYITIFLRNAILDQENRSQFRALQEVEESLEDVLDAYKHQFDLARIALIHGETMHYGQSQLGDALIKLKDISGDSYIRRRAHLDNTISGAIEGIEAYIKKLTDIYEEASELKVHKFDLHKMIQKIANSKQRDWVVYDARTYCKVSPSIVEAPEAQLRQVLLVIVENALQAIGRTGKTGKITFITEAGKDKHGDYIELKVKDNGPGIPVENQDDLFSLKSTFNPARKRSGHGLPWSKGFMRSIRGDVNIFKTDKHGTTIIVKIYRKYGLLGLDRK